jgi:DNA-binding transcriptional LysR family regulator
MDKFTALRVFTRVVDHSGFTAAAAARLGQSPAAVTKTISRLEDGLGAQLFNRSTRRLRTTEFGQQFYQSCLVSRFGPDWIYTDKGKDGQRFTVRVRGSAVINSGDVLRETVVAGGGIAQGTWWLYRKDLARGDVKAILRDYEIEGAPVSVLYPPQRHLPAKLRAFIDFVAQITRKA